MIANQTTLSRYGLFLLCQLRQPTDIGIQVVIHHESDYRISVFSTNVFPFAPNRLWFLAPYAPLTHPVIRQSADIAVWSHLPLSPPSNFHHCCLLPLHKVQSTVHRFRQIFSPPHRICLRTCSSSFVTDPANTNHSLSFVSVCLIYRDGYTVCRLHESSSFSSSSKSLTIFYRHTVIHLAVPQLHI